MPGQTYVFFISNKVQRYTRDVCKSLQFDFPKAFVRLGKSDQILRHGMVIFRMRLRNSLCSWGGIQSSMGMADATSRSSLDIVLVHGGGVTDQQIGSEKGGSGLQNLIGSLRRLGCP